MFYRNDDCNFVDDTNFFACEIDLKLLTERQEHNPELAAEWFENDCMKLHEDKCHVHDIGMELYGLKLGKLGFEKARMKSYLGWIDNS